MEHSKQVVGQIQAKEAVVRGKTKMSNTEVKINNSLLKELTKDPTLKYVR